MRLSKHHQHEIVKLVKKNISSQAEVWLFGSRCDDKARGGDIDLYIETPCVDNLFEKKINLLLQLKDLLGEQKIDLIVRRTNEALLPIHVLAKERGLVLNKSK
ncbi:MAG: nucleotidyltransferase domain-containing protein [Legionella sp.]|jgi:predicted nucleotidyltransferase|nr:nucleotidyltransferase domain-containing protein [Legionella sp.]